MRARFCLVVVVAVAAAVAGCAREPSFPRNPDGDPRLARRQLATELKSAPVTLEVQNEPAGLNAERLARIAARGVRGINTVFTTAPGRQGAARLVLWFSPEPSRAAVCATGGSGASGPFLVAAWCDGGSLVAAVQGSASDAGTPGLERLVWQATRRLFEDDYADTYGFDLLGMRVRLDGSMGF